MEENNSIVHTTATRKYVTIKIEIPELVNLFEDMYGCELKIKNKLKFAELFSKHLKDMLETETLDIATESVADYADESWVKFLDEE